MEPVLLSWSGGKDSCLTLHKIRQEGRYQVRALLTVLSQTYDRISHHGVRNALLQRQARSLNLPLESVYLSENASNEEYKDDRGAARVRAPGDQVSRLRRYLSGGHPEASEEKLALVSMKGVFPLWGEDTATLARRFIALGFKAVVCCVDPRRLEPSFTGREMDQRFLADLPPTVDPCGENGEVHSFVYDGPIFQNRIDHRVGEVVLRPNGNYYCDLLPL